MQICTGAELKLSTYIPLMMPRDSPVQTSVAAAEERPISLRSNVKVRLLELSQLTITIHQTKKSACIANGQALMGTNEQLSIHLLVVQPKHRDCSCNAV